MLEHPAYSDAWPAFGLPTPSRHGGWQKGICGGWACHVEQSRYGHRAKKATWLYAFGADLPSMQWGSVLESKTEAWVSWCGNHTRANGEGRARLRAKEAKATPPPFRDALLSMARSVELMGHRERSATPPQFRDVLVTIARSAEGNR